MSISLDRFGIEGFLKTARRAAEQLRRWASEGVPITVVSHVDADGMAAAGVVASCLYELDAPFRVRIVPWLDDDLASELASGSEGPFVFTDIGSSYMDLLAQHLGTREVIVLDHHPPSGSPPPGWVEVNPHNHGLDGSVDVSGAGVAYLVARELNRSFKRLAPLAVVGALGDMQDRFSGRQLGGLNEIAVRDAVEASLLQVVKDLVFYGRETRPLHKAITYTTSPFIPGVTYCEDVVNSILAKAGIRLKEDDRWRTVSDLSDEEKGRLLDTLAAFLASRGQSPELVRELVGAVYTLVKEEPLTPLRDAREFASLLNACGRMERPDLGVVVCMGDRGKGLEEAMSVLEEYRSSLAKHISWIYSEPGALEERANIVVLHGGSVISDKMIAAVASIVASGSSFRKPLVAYALSPDGEMVKVSARIPPGGPELDIGALLREAAAQCGGQGGGHDVAAGARVPADRVERFLALVDELVGRWASR